MKQSMPDRETLRARLHLCVSLSGVSGVICAVLCTVCFLFWTWDLAFFGVFPMDGKNNRCCCTSWLGFRSVDTAACYRVLGNPGPTRTTAVVAASPCELRFRVLIHSETNMIGPNRTAGSILHIYAYISQCNPC